MTQCFAPDCNHQSLRERCSFFRFPSCPVRRKLWEKLIRRADRNSTKNDYVCSCHFKDGIKENNPTVFSRNKDKIILFTSPEKKTRKRVIKTTVNHPNADVTVSTDQATDSDTIMEQMVPDLHVEPQIAVQSFPQIPATSHKELLLEAEIDCLKREIERLKLKLNMMFNVGTLQGKAERYLLYTGLPNMDIFNLLFELCSRFKFNYYYGWKVVNIDLVDQLLMTLMKIRRNDTNEDLAIRFNCSTHTVGNVIFTWIHVLHEILYFSLMRNVPSRLKNQACLPNCFATFSNCRMTIDCTEVVCAVPRQMNKSNLTYSHYKHNNTLKGLVGVAPNGVVTFMSELYPGSVSDKEIVKDSKVLLTFVPGDLILADKGFLINDVLPAGVSLNIPPFLTNPQFTKSEVLMTKNIARARIHVERAIARIKGFTILDYVPEHLRCHSTKIWQVCGALTNLQYPLLREVNCYFKPIDELE